jgi:hypothetical protein
MTLANKRDEVREGAGLDRHHLQAGLLLARHHRHCRGARRQGCNSNDPNRL